MIGKHKDRHTNKPLITKVERWKESIKMQGEKLDNYVIHMLYIYTHILPQNDADCGALRRTFQTFINIPDMTLL